MKCWKKTGLIFTLAAFALAFGLGAGAAAYAANDPKLVAKYRRMVMQSQAAHMKVMGVVVKGVVDFTDHLPSHALALDAAGKNLVDLFPPGSGADKLENQAKPEIWRDWEKFEAGARRLGQETAKLVEISKSGDFEAFKAQFKAVGKACGGCHKPFRAKKKK